MKNTEKQIAAVSAIVGSALTALGLLVLEKLDRTKAERGKHRKPMTFMELYKDNQIEDGGLFFERGDSDDN